AHGYDARKWPPVPELAAPGAAAFRAQREPRHEAAHGAQEVRQGLAVARRDHQQVQMIAAVSEVAEVDTKALCLPKHDLLNMLTAPGLEQGEILARQARAQHEVERLVVHVGAPHLRVALMQ